MNSVPKILYKYIKWSHDESDVRKDILYKNILYFSNPKDFNDPFDSMLPVLFDTEYFKTEAFHIDFITGMRKIGKNKYTDEEIVKIAKDYVNNPHKIIYKTDVMTEGVRQQILKYTRISCFTTNPHNMLMWSHYANCHKGICIGFVTEGLNDPNLLMLEKVNYSENFPILTTLTNLPLLNTKSKDWEYEEEYRLINVQSFNQIVFEKQSVKEVILGYKMPPEKKQILVPFLRKNYPECVIYYSTPNSTSFKMDIELYQ